VYAAIFFLNAFTFALVEAQQSTYTYDPPGNLTAETGSGSGPPSITTQPQSALLYSNISFSFSVSTVGAGISYQWLSNGIPIFGATGDTLLLTSFNSTNGNFSVIISNYIGSVTSTPAAIWADSNGNGIPDWWELQYFKNLNQTATGDYDGDGVDNLDEYLQGTNPTNAASFDPRLHIQTANGTVLVSPNLPYYTMGQIVTLTAIPDPNQSFLGWTGGAIGTKFSISLVMSTNRTVTASFGLPLYAALDNSNLVWATGGDSPWYGQTGVSEDGFGSAQSGTLVGGQVSWLQTVANLVQPEILAFWWNVSSQAPDALSFSLNGTTLASISGVLPSWQFFRTNLPTGSNFLTWTYQKYSNDNPTGVPFADSAWVDEVQIGTAPVINNQPSSQVVPQGGTALLSATATGSIPLNRQWYFNGSVLTGQTGTNLTLNSVQPSNAGNYIEVISNTFGMVTSAVAVVVVDSTSCMPPPSGLMSWWPANENAVDIVGGNSGVLQGGASYTNCAVGQGFAFGGSNPSLSLPRNFFPFPVSGSTNQPFTFEVWFQTTSGGVIFGQQNGPAYGSVTAYVPGLYVGTDGRLRAEIFWSGTGNPMSSTSTVTNGFFHHTALSYNGTNGILYLDGVSVATNTQMQVAYAPAYYYQFGTGYTPNWPAGNGGWYPFGGLVAGPALFNRALSADEIQSIYDSGSAGMCEPTPYFNLAANSTQWVTNGFRLQVVGLTGQGNVVIYSSTNLLSWNPIFTNPPVIGVLQYVDINATKFANLFYRVLQQ